MELISRREFAKRVGVDEKAIRRAVRNGRISLTNGKIEYESALADWNETRVPGNNNRFGELESDGGSDATPEALELPSLDYYANKARLTKAQADKAEMEAQAMRGILLYSDDVEQVLNAMVGATRARLLAIPTSAAGELIGKTNIAEIQQILTGFVHETLKELSMYDPQRILQQARTNGRKIITEEGE